MKKNKIVAIITVALLILAMMAFWTPNVSSTPQNRIFLPFDTSWEDYQAIGRTNSVDYKKDFYGYYGPDDPLVPELGWRDNEVGPPDVFGYDFGGHQLMASGYFGSSYSYCYFNLFDMTADSDWAPPFKIKPHTFINIWYHHGRLGDCMIDAQLYNKGTHEYSTLRDFNYGGKYVVDQNGVRIHPAHRYNDPVGSWQFVCFDLSIIYESNPENWYVTKIWIGFDNGIDHATGQARTYFDLLCISYGIGGVETKTDGNDNAWTSGSVVACDWYGPDDHGYYKLWLKLTISGFDDGYYKDVFGLHWEIYPYKLKVTTSYGEAQAQTWPEPTGANLTQPLETPPVWCFILDSTMAILGKLTGGFITAYMLAQKFIALQKTPAAQPTYEWPRVAQPDPYYNGWGISPKVSALGEVYIMISKLSAGSHTIPITFDVDYYFDVTPDPWYHYETVSCTLNFEWSTTPDDVNLPPETPSTPSGETSGYTYTTYPYSTSTTDPNGDNVRYEFDWDDIPPPSTIEIPVSEDSFVESYSPSTNFGSDPIIFAGAGEIFGNPIYNDGWLKFSLASIPSGAYITDAKLWLYGCPTNDWWAGVCFSSDDSWSEFTITWNNEPNFGGIIDYFLITVTPENNYGHKYWGWDVTQIVKSEYTGDKTVSFVMVPAYFYNGGGFLSKEYSDGNTPYLEVTFQEKPPPPPTGWYPSGITASASHSWEAPGTYNVKVRAQDSHGLWSGWSPPLTVNVVNSPPNTPSTPSGPTSGYVGRSYTYSTSTTDPDGDKVCYLFYWNDGSITATGHYASGVTVSASHSWSSPGTYKVWVRAQDVYGGTSDWSSYLTVNVGFDSPPATPSTPSALFDPILGTDTPLVYRELWYSTSTTDPDGDDVRYEFDWGDGTTYLTGWYASGDNASAMHAWQAVGTYYVKVRAQDTHDLWSGWSPSLAVTIIYGQGPGSCPFIFSWDGQQYHFDHEAYPFAVMKSVETTSFDRLKYLRDVDGEYRLKIEQVLHEITWIDSFDLYVVDHPGEDSFVMQDLEGNFHTIKELIQPISAYEKNGDDCLEDVKYLDDRTWKDSILDADVNDESTLRNWIVVTFPRPEGATEAKLLLNVQKQTTITKEWEFFIDAIGENYWKDWQKIMEDPLYTQLFLDMLEREIKLRIEVWNGTEWELQGSISAGDSIWDDFLAVLDISDIQGNELQIRLKSTTGHYEINYVGVDYSEDEPMIIHKVKPYHAIKNEDENVLGTLIKSDENYEKLIPNDIIELKYKAIPKSEWKRDYTIAIKGYYNFIDFQDQTYSGFLEGTELWMKALTEPYFVAKTVFPYLQEFQ